MSSTRSETRHVTARVPADLSERLRELAEKNDRTMSGELRVAIREYLAREQEVELFS